MIPPGVQVCGEHAGRFPEGGDGLDGAGVTAALIRSMVRSTYSFEKSGPDQGGLVRTAQGCVCLPRHLRKRNSLLAPDWANHGRSLNHAQLLALVDGLDWKKIRPMDVKWPQSLVKNLWHFESGV